MVTRRSATRLAPDGALLGVLTESGGIQEEAPSLGKPVLVMRTTTERPEAIAAGTARLIGTDRKAIVEGVRTLLDDPQTHHRMATAVNPYGDGQAARRTTAAIAHLLTGGPAPTSSPLVRGWARKLASAGAPGGQLARCTPGARESEGPRTTAGLYAAAHACGPCDLPVLDEWWGANRRVPVVSCPRKYHDGPLEDRGSAAGGSIRTDTRARLAGWAHGTRGCGVIPQPAAGPSAGWTSAGPAATGEVPCARTPTPPTRPDYVRRSLRGSRAPARVLAEGGLSAPVGRGARVARSPRRCARSLGIGPGASITPRARAGRHRLPRRVPARGLPRPRGFRTLHRGGRGRRPLLALAPGRRTVAFDPSIRST